MGLTKEHYPNSEDVMEHNSPSLHPHAPTSHPPWPCKFLFFLCYINDPSRRLTLPPVITAFSSFWCDFRTLGVSKDWGAFIVIRNRHNAPFFTGPLTTQFFFFFLNHLPFPPEINPVWAIDAVWPFGCNLHFFINYFFLQSPQLSLGEALEDLKFLPEPRFSGAWQPNGATEKHLSQFTERACVGTSHCHGPLMHAPRAPVVPCQKAEFSKGGRQK